MQYSTELRGKEENRKLNEIIAWIDLRSMHVIILAQTMSQSDLSIRHRFVFTAIFSFAKHAMLYGSIVCRWRVIHFAHSIRWFFLHFRIEDDLCLTVYEHLVCCVLWLVVETTHKQLKIATIKWTWNFVCVFAMWGAIAPTIKYLHNLRFIFIIAAARICRTYWPYQYIYILITRETIRLSAIAVNRCIDVEKLESILAWPLLPLPQHRWHVHYSRCQSCSSLQWMNL